MEFPETNKHHQDINESFGQTAKLVEESMKKIDWLFFVKLYAGVIGCLLATVFAFIVIIKLAVGLMNLIF